MSFITLEEAKAHLRVDGSDEDTLIAAALNAAERYCVTYLNRGVYVSQEALDAAIAAEEASANAMVILDDIRYAMLLVLGHLYANREDNVTGTIVSELKLGARNLLQPYRIMPGL